MELKDLQERLRDPDQWVRVETLRILAMVEETRAIRDVEWVYKNDPEPGVRQVAQWAGRIIFTAYKQEKQTGAAALPAAAGGNRREETLLDSLVEKTPATYGMMQEQRLQQELSELMKTGSAETAARAALPSGSANPESRDAKRIGDGKRGTGTNEIVMSPDTQSTLDLDELLDAGLSEDFFVGFFD